MPLAPLFGYVGALRSMTQERDSYSMRMHGYADAPDVIAATKG